EVGGVGLQLNCLGHAAQPGIPLGFAYRPAGMKHGYADLTVALLKQLGTTKPAAEKAGQLVPGHGQIFRMHATDALCLGPAVHNPVEIVYQPADSLNSTGCLV